METPDPGSEPLVISGYHAGGQDLPTDRGQAGISCLAGT